MVKNILSMVWQFGLWGFAGYETHETLCTKMTDVEEEKCGRTTLNMST